MESCVEDPAVASICSGAAGKTGVRLLPQCVYLTAYV